MAITATDSRSDLQSAAGDIDRCAAWGKVEAERLAWTERLPAGEADIFPWLLAQDNTTVQRLLSFVVAVTATGVHGAECGPLNNDTLARALGLDMCRWWKAAGPSYFNHVSKRRILDVVAEAAGANQAASLAPLKKEAVVASAEQAIAATGWLPSCWRTPASVGAHRDQTALPEEGLAG